MADPPGFQNQTKPSEQTSSNPYLSSPNPSSLFNLALQSCLAALSKSLNMANLDTTTVQSPSQNPGSPNTVAQQASSLKGLTIQSVESKMLTSSISQALEQVYPSLLSPFLSTIKTLYSTISALEEKLLDAAESIKRRNRELVVVKEYHKVLLKKYRLLVTREEFVDHLNGYDKKLKMDVTFDEPIEAGRKLERERQEKATAVMKIYEDNVPDIAPGTSPATDLVPISSRAATKGAESNKLSKKEKPTKDQGGRELYKDKPNKEMHIDMGEQDKKEKHEPSLNAISTKPKDLDGLKQPSKAADGGKDKHENDGNQYRDKSEGTGVQNHATKGEIRKPGENRAPSKIIEPAALAGKPGEGASRSAARTRQKQATPPRANQSSHHSEYYTIDLEQSSFRTGEEEGRTPSRKKAKDDSRLAQEIFGNMQHDLSVIEPAIARGKSPTDRGKKGVSRKQEQFLDANEDRDLILAAVGHKSLDPINKAPAPSRNQLLRKKESETGLKAADLAGSGRDGGGSKSTDRAQNGQPKLPPLNLGGGPRSLNSGLVHNIDYGRFGAAKVDGIMEKKYYNMS
jgi:hypothetical protein